MKNIFLAHRDDRNRDDNDTQKVYADLELRRNVILKVLDDAKTEEAKLKCRAELKEIGKAIEETSLQSKKRP